MDPTTAGANLMKNPQFMEMFQRALGEGKIPDEKDPNRDAWLRDMQAKLSAEAAREAKKTLEQVQSDENGQWMWIVPDAGFCIKCSAGGGAKVFINICKHERIAEPIPLPEEEQEEDAIKFRIPLSCGQARPDTDKSGKPCKVYDVIVNPMTVQRCGEDAEFRRFVAALCMTWIKQKSEPTLNADEFKNVNFKCKGVPEAQRIRLSAAPRAANAMGDEIKLPQSAATGSAPTAAGGGAKAKLVEEVAAPAATSAAAAGAPAATGVQSSVTPEGQYDWARHKRPARHPHFRDTVPAAFVVEVTIPAVSTIAEVDVQVLPRGVALRYVDADAPFLTLPLPFHVAPEPAEARFVRAKKRLRLKLAVALQDETDDAAKTKPSRDATEVEEEERRAAEAAAEARIAEQRARLDRIARMEADVMAQRKQYVENLTAVQEGAVPPVLREELDAMAADQQRAMLLRLEGRVRRGDSIDEMLDRFPPEMLDAIVDYLRDKLGLERRPKAKPAAAAAAAAAAPAAAAAERSEWEKQIEDPQSIANVEYNFAKKSEQLFGVMFTNRYLFALDH